MKKLLAVILMFLSISPVSFSTDDYVDYTIGESTITVNYDTSDGVHKVGIETSDNLYVYPFNDNSVIVPLQSGDCAYNVIIYENIGETLYKRVYEETIDVVIKECVFLQPTTMIDYENSNLDQFLEMDIEDIHNYMMDNFSYDYSKISTLDTNYTVAIDEMLNNPNGICMDFSIVFAGIARNNGIPCKVVYGKTSFYKALHAWNEVYIDGEWKIIDITLNLEYRNKGYSYDLYQDSYFYDKQQEY